MGWISKQFDAISDSELEQWLSIVNSDAAYRSPFLHPAFVRACSSVLEGVEIGLHLEGEQVTAVFPFLRSGKAALPVVLSLTDFEAIATPKGTSVDPKSMLRDLGLRRWDFCHLVNPESYAASCRWATMGSPFVDLQGGFDAYFEALSRRHSSITRNHRQNCRRIEQSLGRIEVRFEHQAYDLLETLLEWKSAQYESSGREHPFRQAWARKALAHFMHVGDKSFRGTLIVLYGGSKPLAMEYCLATDTVTHALVAAYDVEYARVSPGSVLQILGLKKLAESGVEIHDLGKGNELYKQKFKSGETLICEGTIETNPLRNFSRHAFHRSRYKFLESSASEPARIAARQLAERFPRIRKILRMR